MSVAAQATTLATGALWRVTGSRRLADTLVARAIAGGEDESSIAMMMLTQGGDRAVPVVTAAIAGGQADLVDVLVSIGTDAAREALTTLTELPEPTVAAEAQRGLALVDRARHHKP